MNRFTFVLAILAVAGLGRPALAQDLDCAKPIKTAQEAIDKVTDDMKGMEHMPKDQLLQVHTLIDDAKMLLDGARHNCDQPKADFDRARAIAKAEGARGAARAADALHFSFMKGSAAMPGMRPASGGGIGHSHPMPNMKQ